MPAIAVVKADRQSYKRLNKSTKLWKLLESLKMTITSRRELNSNKCFVLYMFA